MLGAMLTFGATPNAPFMSCQVANCPVGTETTTRMERSPASANGRVAARSPIRVNSDTQLGVGSEFNGYPHIHCYARSLKERVVIPKSG
jgi:hypothetical protein